MKDTVYYNEIKIILASSINLGSKTLNVSPAFLARLFSETERREDEACEAEGNDSVKTRRLKSCVHGFVVCGVCDSNLDKKN